MYKTFFVSAVVSLNAILGHVASAQNEGDVYIQNSLKALLAARTIEGDIRIETYVDGHEYIARGRYEEQVLPGALVGTFLRSMYRLEINFSMPPSNAADSEQNRMTLVCHPSEDREQNQIDRYTSIEGVRSFSTIDLTRLEERLQSSNNKTVFAHISEVRNLGGLAGTMRQIQRFYEFALPSPETLQEEKSLAVWKLTGTLRTTYQEELLARFGGLDSKGRYPVDFPSDVEIWLGLHNDFPYKIRYSRRLSETVPQKELLFQESFYKVTVNGTPIPATKFTPLNPPENVFPQDDTEKTIKDLGL